VSGDDGAAKGIGAAEQAVGQREVAAGDGLANDGGGDFTAAKGEHGGGVDREIEGGAEVEEGIDMAGLLVAEAEVGADDYGFGLELIEKDLADELFRGEEGEGGGEGDDVDFGDAEGLDELAAFVNGGDEERGAFRGDDAGGVGVKG